MCDLFLLIICMCLILLYVHAYCTLGYYFTGDGAKRDEDGYYWITGRVDDVINPSGHRIGKCLFLIFICCCLLFLVCTCILFACIIILLSICVLISSRVCAGTAEIESALVSCAEFVSEAAVVGFPHEIKGEGIGCYIILR